MNKKLFAYTILESNGIYNSINLIKKKGYLILPNNFRLSFNKENEKDIKNLFAFGLFYGVEFSYKEGYWHYNNDIITTPNNIRFNIKNFEPLIFSETFLSDIHFSDFDLNNRIII